MKRGWMLLLILFAAAWFSGPADARLIVIGTATYTGVGANDSGGMLGGGQGMPGMPVEDKDAAGDYNLIYEDDQGLIWLDFTNGRGIWPKQAKWAAGLNGPGVLTYRFNPGISVLWEGDWRLPRAADGPRYFGYDGKTNTAGYNITADELGHLFYTSLGNQGAYDAKGVRRTGGGMPEGGMSGGSKNLKNTAPFIELKASVYWTGTQYLYYEGIWCWNFNMGTGLLSTWGIQEDGFNAIAVRPAKVSGLGN